MRMFLATLIIIIACGNLCAQKSRINSEILSPADIEKYLGEDFSRTFLKGYSIQRAYRYEDASGMYYLALGESRDEITKDDTLNHNITAVAMKQAQSGVAKMWAMNDFINSHDLQSGGETSIWYWTKFCELKDLDGDEKIDPLLVYGTAGLNGYDDGRVKVILYYGQAQKIAIRCQNSTMDEGRNINVDAAFYTLPSSVQQHIRKLMKVLEDKGFIIYPPDYEKSMDKKKLLIY
jgi:hypothetical protein